MEYYNGKDSETNNLNKIDEKYVMEMAEEMKKSINSLSYDANVLSRFENNQWRDVCEFERFVEYKNINGYYMGIDCDVALSSIVMYQILHPSVAEGKICKQFRSTHKYEIKLDENHNNEIYRGDTLTSAWTIFKKYLICLWYQETNNNDFKKLFISEKDYYGNLSIGIPDEYKKKIKSAKMLDYFIFRCKEVCEGKTFCDIINETTSIDAQKFLNIYMTPGNYIMIPKYFNCERSYFGEWDTVDRLLWKFYQYYYYKNVENNVDKAKRVIESIFYLTEKNLQSKQKHMELSVCNCLKWLDRVGAKTWEDFINIFSFESFVVNNVPISLVSGKPIERKQKNDKGNIDCFDMDSENYCEYSSIPHMPKEWTNQCNELIYQFEIFFKESNKRILNRGKNIYCKIKEGQ